VTEQLKRVLQVRRDGLEAAVVTLTSPSYSLHILASHLYVRYPFPSEERRHIMERCQGVKRSAL
jgi:hypothetical protein